MVFYYILKKRASSYDLSSDVVFFEFKTNKLLLLHKHLTKIFVDNIFQSQVNPTEIPRTRNSSEQMFAFFSKTLNKSTPFPQKKKWVNF